MDQPISKYMGEKIEVPLVMVIPVKGSKNNPKRERKNMLSNQKHNRFILVYGVRIGSYSRD